MSNLRLPQGIGPTKSYNEDHLALLGRRPSEISEGAPEGPFLGKNFRENAPFRAKVTPPYERGVVMVIKGHIWGDDTREPLPHVKLDVWQADAKGKYDDENGTDPVKPDTFINRARLYSDRDGYYELETIHPGSYKANGPNGLFWRAPHIHIRARCPQYETLVTEISFEGDPHHDNDLFLIPSTVLTIKLKKRNGREYEEATFDIVLSPRPAPANHQDA